MKHGRHPRPGPRARWGIARALALTAFVSSCVISIDPVVPESESIYDPRLLGSWEESAGSDRAVVSRATDSTYGIEYAAEGKTGYYEARLGRLGDRLILDVWPAPPEGDLPPPYAGLLIPGHLLLTLDVGLDEVHLAALEPDSLIAALRSKRVRLRHSRAGDQLILRGTTDELRAALDPYLARPGALTDAGAWRRGTRAPLGPVDVPCFEAAAWREADQLFHRDPHWLGADGASSVDLGKGRILWLFGDTWVDPSGRGTRDGAHMVSNSVAIQTGADPQSATITFYWKTASDGTPSAFVPDRGAERHWFGNGVRLDDRLVLFLNRVISTNTGLGFESVGWRAVMVQNPDADPSAWMTRSLEAPENPLGILLGFAFVLRLGDHVYALGSQNPLKSHPIYAARWLAERVHAGNLLEPEWWAGDRLGWVPDSSRAPRWPLFENGQSELSVLVDSVTNRFLAVHTQGFGPADVMMRAAPALTGPWSAPRMVYRPPEYSRPNAMVYAGKAHPHLAGGDLLLTYATNTFQFAEHLTDPSVYYPRFVRLTRCTVP